MNRRPNRVLLSTILVVLIVGGLSGDASADQSAKARLVEAGDQITFYLSDLTGPDRLVQPVQWKKNLRTRKADYIQLAARYDADGMPGFVVLLVQDSYVDRLVYRCPDSTAETCTLTIDGEFQYGGDTDGNMRFIVFHDPSVGQWQHRFVNENLSSNFARGVQRFGDDAGYETAVADVRKVAQFGVDYLGEFLIDFSAAGSTAAEPEPVRLVQLGDPITFYLGDLTGPERRVQVVEWSENLQKVEAPYIQLAARLDVDDKTTFVIVFVQEETADRLAARCQDPMALSCTITVDAEFQYGGDSDGTMRFLVFHNRRALGIYQHRFVNQTMAKNFAVGMEGLEESAQEMNVPTFGAEMAIESVMKLSEMGQAMFGDPLRDF